MIAWHYTTGEKFVQIVESGLLLPTSAYLAPGERPILWFSLNQAWELTANKGWEENGTSRLLDMEETRERGRGLVRFGIVSSRLIPWPKLGRKARMADSTVSQLTTRGKEVGANPKQWCGTFSPMPLQALQIAVMDDSGGWENVTPSREQTAA